MSYMQLGHVAVVVLLLGGVFSLYLFIHALGRVHLGTVIPTIFSQHIIMISCCDIQTTVNVQSKMSKDETKILTAKSSTL